MLNSSEYNNLINTLKTKFFKIKAELEISNYEKKKLQTEKDILNSDIERLLKEIKVLKEKSTLTSNEELKEDINLIVKDIDKCLRVLNK